MQPFSEFIWGLKYQLKDKNNVPVDADIPASKDRVAKALASVEKDKKKWQKEFREVLEYCVPAGRIMSNAGAEAYKSAVSLINCTVSDTIQDSMESIFEKLSEAALTLKAGCGIGYEFSSLRPKGAFVHGAGAATSGPLSFMDVYDKMCLTIMSAGGRRGAQMATFDISHPDVIDFIKAKREDGRLRHFNLSVLITDDFIEAVKKDELWELKWNGEVYNTVKARELWDIIMQSTYDYAEPGFLLIDKINKMNNLWFTEIIRATNPCGEQPLPTYGSCLLGSIMLHMFVVNPFTDKAYFDYDKYKKCIRVFTRMLDNVVEMSGLPLAEQRWEIESKRRHGMGYLGLGSALAMLQIRYGSAEAVKFTEEVTRELAMTGFETGVELAKEKGMAPILSQKFKREDVKQFASQNKNQNWNGDKKEYSGKELMVMSHYFDAWRDDTRGSKILKDLAKHGCRFSHHSSIAPTGTISASFGENCSNGIEPSFDHSYIRNVIVAGNASKQDIETHSYEFHEYKRINPSATPDNLPDYFVVTDDLTPREHVDMQAAAQKWIDSSISKTINVPTDIDFDTFKDVYLYGYEKGLKGCTTFRFNPEVFTGVLVKKDDLKKTKYRFNLKDGSHIEVTGDQYVMYEGQQHLASNLADALKNGYYKKL